MGIIDDIKLQFKQPNNTVVQLIILNVAIWIPFTLLAVISQVFGGGFIYSFIFENVSLPSTFSSFIFRPWTLLTYGFFHSSSSIFHIIMNMYILYLFGRLLASVYGNNRVLSSFILGILGGGALYLLAYNFVPFFMEKGPAQLIGASAGVTAVVVATATFMPDYRFNLLLIGPIKIVYIAVVMVFLSYIGTTGSNAGGQLSHLGGALIGFIYARLMLSGTDIGKWVITLRDFFANVFKPKPKVKVSYKKDKSSNKATSSKPSASSNFATQSEIDAILDKISHSGYESLTTSEKQKLFSVSQKN